MGWRRVLDLAMQSGNIIVVLGCVLALFAAQQYAISIVQVTTLTEAQPSRTTVTTTVTQQFTSTTSATCTPGHCSFTVAITQPIGVSASLGGEVHHTTTMLNPEALSRYQFFVDLGWYLAIAGLIFSLANFSVWLYRRHRSHPTKLPE
jgi:hypothetical protein